MENNKTQDELYDELQKEWLEVEAEVTALLLNYYRPDVEVAELPTKIDLLYAQYLIEQILKTQK